MKDVKTDQIIQIRNPQGKFEWNGDWSDKSSKWTTELKKECGWSDKDDGTFWMSWNDVKKYFNSISINTYRDDSDLTSTPVTLKKDEHFILKVTIPKGRHVFSLQQISCAMFDKNVKYKYNPCHLVLVKLNNGKDIKGGTTYICGKIGETSRDTHIDVNKDLEAGTYAFFGEVEFRPNTPAPAHTVAITRYGPSFEEF